MKTDNALVELVELLMQIDEKDPKNKEDEYVIYLEDGTRVLL